MDNITKEYILCSAIHFDDGNEEHVHQPKNIVSGFVVCGRRHHNCFITAFILNGEESVTKKVASDGWKITEGFVTNTDRFVDRKEAMPIAFEAGQIPKEYELLISEHLW